jgi:hypothetical protein
MLCACMQLAFGFDEVYGDGEVVIPETAAERAIAADMGLPPKATPLDDAVPDNQSALNYQLVVRNRRLHRDGVALAKTLTIREEELAFSEHHVSYLQDKLRDVQHERDELTHELATVARERDNYERDFTTISGEVDFLRSRLVALGLYDIPTCSLCGDWVHTPQACPRRPLPGCPILPPGPPPSG